MKILGMGKYKIDPIEKAINQYKLKLIDNKPLSDKKTREFFKDTKLSFYDKISFDNKVDKLWKTYLEENFSENTLVKKVMKFDDSIDDDSLDEIVGFVKFNSGSITILNKLDTPFEFEEAAFYHNSDFDNPYLAKISESEIIDHLGKLANQYKPDLNAGIDQALVARNQQYFFDLINCVEDNKFNMRKMRKENLGLYVIKVWEAEKVLDYIPIIDVDNKPERVFLDLLINSGRIPEESHSQIFPVPECTLDLLLKHDPLCVEYEIKDWIVKDRFQ